MRRQLRFLLFGLAPVLAQAASLALSPLSGALSGFPGSTVGWGFTVGNPGPNYLVVSGASLCTTIMIGGMTVCDQYPDSLGTFTDYIAQFNFIVAGPAPENPSATQAFSQTLLTGIGSFTFSAGSAAHAPFSGQILLTYDLYSRSPNDPLFNPQTDTVSSGNTLTANASVQAVPEPSTFLMLAAGLAAVTRRTWLKRYEA